MQRRSTAPIRVLFLCTHNSARSQIAEALLRKHGGEKFHVASAGSDPAQRVHPLAVEMLESLGADPDLYRPKGFDDVVGREWDIVITVCDRAREACPHFPGRPAVAHWGLPDPAAVEASEEEQRRAFRDTTAALARRIDLLLALPIDKLEILALEQQMSEIGETEQTTRHPS